MAGKCFKVAHLINALIEKTGIDLHSYESDLPDSVTLRNKQLFPLLKNKSLFIRSEIYLRFEDAVQFVQILAKVVPEIKIEIDVSIAGIHKLLAPLAWLNEDGNNTEQTLLIRHANFTMK
jgi:hypothetical protein